MRALFVIVTLTGLSACIDSPTVELVGIRDAAATSTPTASPQACDAQRCTAAGGTCTSDGCKFTCPGAAVCNEDVRCPAGMPCSVSCFGKEACAQKVECREATSCTISCDGEHACKGGVTCAGSSCAVTCQNNGCERDDVKCCEATSCTLNGASITCP
jgi:hypothetical protein